MATTTITITEEAYRALKAEEGESFSNVILRKFQKAIPLRSGQSSKNAALIQTLRTL